MGWYAFYSWRASFDNRFKHSRNMIYYYKEYVLKTPEQREIERKEGKKALANILATLTVMSSVVNNSYYGKGYLDL